MNKKKLNFLTNDCQVGMYYSAIKNLKNGYVVYSDIVESETWNSFTGFKSRTAEDFEKTFGKAKDFFCKINRTPVFTLNASTKISKKVKMHIEKNYSAFSHEAILLTKRFVLKKDLSSDYSFRRIDNKTERALFVNTFKTSKSQSLPGDTYEPLPQYFFDALDNSFNNKTSWDFIHYVSLYKGKPVGMISACVKGKCCGLYGGGTFVKHRGKGVFTNLLNYIYLDLKKQGVKYFFGKTEKGSKNEKLYNAIGWKTKAYEIYYK